MGIQEHNLNIRENYPELDKAAKHLIFLTKDALTVPHTKHVSISVTGKHSKSTVVQTKSISKAPGKIDNRQFSKNKNLSFQ